MSIIATKYGYDKLGNRNMVQDPNGNVTYFNYDLQSRLRSTISPDGNVAYYEYNKVGNVTSKKDENGDTIDYTYDNLYRLIRKDYPDSTHAYFTYDAVGRRLHMQDANTLTYFTYACGCGNRIATVHDCILDKWISYTYDKKGRRDSMTDPEGDVIYYDYGKVNLLRIKRNTSEEAYFAYDAAGRRNYTVLGNSSYTYYDYDINGRLTRVANHKSDDSVISTFDYTLGPVGNRIAMQIDSGDTVYYEYDGIYQLVKEDRRQSDDSLVYINYFEYDLAGNRTHLHYVDGGTDDWTYYTYNIENQLTIEEKGGSATYYEHDAAGALLRKDVAGAISYYEYNYEGLMDRFDEGEDVATFTFDADNRRIAADRNGTVEKYVLSQDDVVADYDSDNTLIATYNTPSLDNNVTKKVNENIYFYLKDALGSIRNLLDSSEVLQNTYDYSAFGSIFGSPTENIANRYRFTAREWESIPSLHFYRSRMYSQRVGRFLTKDDIRLFGDVNLYRYVGNKPVHLTDPMGRIPCIYCDYAYADSPFNCTMYAARRGMTYDYCMDLSEFWKAVCNASCDISLWKTVVEFFGIWWEEIINFYPRYLQELGRRFWLLWNCFCALLDIFDKALSLLNIEIPDAKLLVIKRILGCLCAASGTVEHAIAAKTTADYVTAGLQGLAECLSQFVEISFWIQIIWSGLMNLKFQGHPLPIDLEGLQDCGAAFAI